MGAKCNNARALCSTCTLKNPTWSQWTRSPLLRHVHHNRVVILARKTPNISLFLMMMVMFYWFRLWNGAVPNIHIAGFSLSGILYVLFHLTFCQYLVNLFLLHETVIISLVLLPMLATDRVVSISCLLFSSTRTVNVSRLSRMLTG